MNILLSLPVYCKNWIKDTPRMIFMTSTLNIHIRQLVIRFMVKISDAGASAKNKAAVSQPQL